MRTMWEALKICLPITLMTFGIFTRSDMVVTTGWPQLAATALVLVSVCGISLAMFGRFMQQASLDIPIRLLLAAISLVVMFHPDDFWATAAAVIVLPATIAGIWRHKTIATPEAVAEYRGDETPKSMGDPNLLNEAKRDFG